MRQTSFNIQNTSDSVATYPDEMCFAFNPNFVEIESACQSCVLTVIINKFSGLDTVSPQSIKVSMYEGKARVYLSRLFELMFDDPRNSRCVEVGVTVKKDTTTLFTFSTHVIWGNLAVGERFGNLGVYNRDNGKIGFERNLIWFKKFPFTVSLFRYSMDLDFYGRTDNSRYDIEPIYIDTENTLTTLGFKDISPSEIFPTAQNSATIKYKRDIKRSTFDNTFDSSFFKYYEEVSVLINLKICNDTAGYYLRWVDRHGNLQYFLFTKGETSYKNKPGSDSVLQDEALNGMYFANLMRTRHLECTISKKSCAVNLPSDIFDYVVTIVTAPIVDLYCGKDETGTDIWLPVNIDASTVKHIPKQVLNDLEFSFSLPDVNAQSL